MARYEYETSPRKIEPEYRPKRNKKNVQKNEREQLKKEVKKKAKNSVRLKNAVKIKRKRLVIGIFVSFMVLLAISYRNSLINENFSIVKSLKNELATIEKENEQLQVNIESSINLKNIEQVAQEKLKMQKLLPEQKIYINLPKKDYVEPATEEIKIEENKSILQKIIDFIKGQ